ncbi:MAG: pyridoxal-phosphate dependent enzyme [Flavicella sp.]|nr:pyridoxal-phosphate dependent enzyme [Flavicella sp.]
MQAATSNIEEIFLPELRAKEVRLFVKREDALHPVISGNKYRKLFYKIAFAKKKGYSKLWTFGGAFSNHILATAGAGFEFGFKTVGIIRGEELGVDIEKTLLNNETLRRAKDYGMQFEFISRSDYKEKSSQSFLLTLKQKYPNAYILPEGGTNDKAIQGCEEILNDHTEDFEFICCAVGTGGTISGIINSSSKHQQVLGFPALKGDFLENEIKGNKVNKNNWEIIPDYHFGGYAKINEELITFNNNFFNTSGVLLDPVYTGKMFYGIVDMVNKDKFAKGTKILAIHTGGLQGILGMNSVLAKKNMPLLIDRNI